MWLREGEGGGGGSGGDLRNAGMCDVVKLQLVETSLYTHTHTYINVHVCIGVL